MALSIGIVGLPNVGKSTTFNALTRAQHAATENYPFCTIEPNRAIVPVPDYRLMKLAEFTGVSKAIQATIEFVDIAGLVRGASQGEGLGNQFLGQIRDTAAIVHVVRCFDDESVIHVNPSPEPRNDIEVVNTELILADLQQLERKKERLTSQVKGDKKAIPILELAQRLEDHLERNNPISTYSEQEDEVFKEFLREMNFLTAKPVIYVANVDEAGLAEDNDYVREVREVAAEQEAQVVKISSRLEADMADWNEEERQEFLQLAGTEASGLDQIIRTGYRILNLISFFTMNEREVRAWTVKQGWSAPRAAGVIHTDFEKGFIRAEIVPYETFALYGSWAATKAAGQMRVEGKDYIVRDGDVIYFRFNV